MSGSLPGSSTSSRTHLRQVELNGIPLTLRGPLQTEIINIHGRKVNIGEVGPDKHPVNSTIIQTSWQGGGQIWSVNPAQDMQRFWWGIAMTEYPEYLTLPPYTSEYDVGSAPMILGDYPNDDDAGIYASAGGDLWLYDLVTDLWESVDTFDEPPINKGTQYMIQTGADEGDSLLFIPETTQYETFNGTALSGAIATEAIEFAVWDNKLFRLTGSGGVYWTTDAATWFKVGQIPDGSMPRHLVQFVNRQDAPTLHVVTNHYVWALNFDSAVLVQTKLFNPRHPFAGQGAVVHQGDMYVSAGMGVMRYNLQTIAPTGIDRDHGVPVEFRGTIVDMESGYNGLFALVLGQGVDEEVLEEETLDLGGGDDPMYAAGTVSNSLLMVWNGDGWHYRWHRANVIPTNLFVSQADHIYKIWWAAGSKIYSQTLPYTYFNPRDPDNVLVEFATSGDFETGWNEWGWQGQKKLLKKIEIGVKQASVTEFIEVYYKIDEEENPWVHVGDITEAGVSNYFLGLDIANPVMIDGTPRYQGVNHERYRLRFVMHRGSTKSTKPVIHWYSVVGRKLLYPQRSWRFVADMTQRVRNYPPGFLTHLIEELPLVGYAVPFKYRGKDFMVDVVAVSGPDDEEGNVERSYRTIHLLESNEIAVGDHEHAEV